MGEMEIRPNTVATAAHGVYARATVVYQEDEAEGANQIELPASTIPLKHKTDGDNINSDARNVVEVHRSIEAGEVSDLRDGNSYGWNRQLKKHNQSDLVFGLTSFEPEDADQDHPRPIEFEEARAIIESGNDDDRVDVLGLPVQRAVIRGIRKTGSFRANEEFEPEGDNDGYLGTSFTNYFEGLTNIRDALEEVEPEKPVMGTVPLLKYNHINGVLDVYEEHGIDVIGVNMIHRSPLGLRQTDRITSIVSRLDREGTFGARLLYAMNPVSPHREIADDWWLAGLGFSIIGENHMRNAINSEDGRPIPEKDSVRLFDKGDIIYSEHSQDQAELSDVWPADSRMTPLRFTGINMDTVRKREQLFNPEQHELLLKKVRDTIDAGQPLGTVVDQKGMKETVEARLKKASDAVNAS